MKNYIAGAEILYKEEIPFQINEGLLPIKKKCFGIWSLKRGVLFSH